MFTLTLVITRRCGFNLIFTVICTGAAGGAGQSRVVTMENMAKVWPNHSFASTWPPRHLLPTDDDSSGPRPRTSHGRKRDGTAAAHGGARPFTVAAPQMLSLDDDRGAAENGGGGAAVGGGTGQPDRSSVGGSSKVVVTADDRFDRLRYWADCSAVHPFFFSRRREGAPPRRV